MIFFFILESLENIIDCLFKPLYHLNISLQVYDMLKSVKLTNFLSFKEQTIELHPKVNVLIGVNGSGKSNFLKALTILQESVKKRLSRLIINNWGGLKEIIYSNGEPLNNFNINYTFSEKLLSPEYDKELHYNLTFNRLASQSNYYVDEKLIFDDGKDDYFIDMAENQNSDSKNKTETLLSNYFDNTNIIQPLLRPQNKKIFEYFKSINVYENFDTRMNSNLRSKSLITPESHLDTDGSNLASLLNRLEIDYPDNFLNIIDKFQDVNSSYKNINLDLNETEIRIKLKESSLSNFISSRHISDGTLRYLCLLAILYNPNRGKLVCIDEPETGLHPDMLFNIADGIREASKDTQFIIATHSNILLDSFDIENIRVFEKNEKNETIVTRVNEEKLKEDETLGEMWRNGVLGGNRW